MTGLHDRVKNAVSKAREENHLSGLAPASDEAKRVIATLPGRVQAAVAAGKREIALANVGTRLAEELERILIAEGMFYLIWRDQGSGLLMMAIPNHA